MIDHLVTSQLGNLSEESSKGVKPSEDQLEIEKINRDLPYSASENILQKEFSRFGDIAEGKH